jgi:hypothetical protein
MSEALLVDGEVGYYLDHISAYEREFKQWESRVKKLTKRYRMDDRTDASPDRFNVLWSNVQTLKAATYARMPQPDVSRRFRDNDPVGRVASLMLERAIEFEIHNYADFRLTMQHVVYDRFLGGRGTAWVRYHPITKTVEVPKMPESVEDFEAMITDDAPLETEQQEVLDFETCPTDYVHWQDFGHNVARTWEEVTIVWRKVYLSREECIERFGEEIGKTIPMDATPNEDKKTDNTDGVNKRGLVFEIWDKTEGKAFWLSKSIGQFLDEREDPLEIEGFFPCPRPIFSTLTTETLVPIPDFKFYEDQAAKLDELADRISGLISALQVRGVHDASIPELARLFKEGQNGDLIPVNNWAAFAEKKGLSGAIDIVEILPIAQALGEAYKAFEQVKQHIYELTGIADIIRGQTAASETATAQQIKNSYASLRLKVYQDEVERFASDLFNIKAQIICKHFDPQTLCKMSACDQLQPDDQQLIPQAIALLKDNVTREFRIAVETDSMAFQDEQQEKQDRMEFLQATASFIAQVNQAAQETPQLLPLGIELLKFGVSGFRVGKTLEGVIDNAAEQLKAAAQQPKPNPEMQKLQAQQQSDGAKLQQEAQFKQAEMAQAERFKQAEMQAESQANAQKAAQEEALQRAKIESEERLELQRMQLKDAAEAREAERQERIKYAEFQRDIAIAEADRRTKLEIAEISANATLQASQAKAAEQASKDEPVTEEKNSKLEEMHGEILSGLGDLVKTLKAPKKRTGKKLPDGSMEITEVSE